MSGEQSFYFTENWQKQKIFFTDRQKFNIYVSLLNQENFFPKIIVINEEEMSVITEKHQKKLLCNSFEGPDKILEIYEDLLKIYKNVSETYKIVVLLPELDEIFYDEKIYLNKINFKIPEKNIETKLTLYEEGWLMSQTQKNFFNIMFPSLSKKFWYSNSVTFDGLLERFKKMREYILSNPNRIIFGNISITDPVLAEEIRNLFPINKDEIKKILNSFYYFNCLKTDFSRCLDYNSLPIYSFLYGPIQTLEKRNYPIFEKELKFVRGAHAKFF